MKYEIVIHIKIQSLFQTLQHIRVILSSKNGQIWPKFANTTHTFFTAGNALWGNVVPVLSVTFATLWILPFYLLSKVSHDRFYLFSRVMFKYLSLTSFEKPKDKLSFVMKF